MVFSWRFLFRVSSCESLHPLCGLRRGPVATDYDQKWKVAGRQGDYFSMDRGSFPDKDEVVWVYGHMCTCLK